MRTKREKQLPISGHVPNDPFARELEAISAVLDDNRTIYDLASQDLADGKLSNRGRKGMTGEQVVRCAVLKYLYDCDYRELAFHLVDSTTAQWFSRLPYKKNVKFQTLQRNIKCIKPETWEKINQLLVQHARDEGIEKGKKIRTDCTVVEANIHHPTDSSLLNDCVRVLTRLLSTAREEYPQCTFAFHDHRRAAKRRMLEIANARNGKKRRKAYRKLLRLCEETIRYANEAIFFLQELGRRNTSILDGMTVESLAEEIETYIGCAWIVIDQTYRRVFNGEEVPAHDKIVSIFEPHTDIIVKDRREALYGHKVCLSTGASSLITDIVVEDGNPADSTLVERCLERHKDTFNYYPRHITLDGGFASRGNLAVAKSKEGVENVVFAKKRGLKVQDMAKSMWLYRNLRRFRAGVEGCISAIKRICGLNVCSWKGYAGFKSYVHCGVVAFNLLVIARHLLA
jgi:IS5 family transposase